MTEGPFRNEAPDGETLTAYDEQHLVGYLRLLDAVAEEADWREIVAVLFEIDPDRDPDRARRMFDTHLSRARWMSRTGYRQLVGGPRVGD